MKGKLAVQAAGLAVAVVGGSPVAVSAATVMVAAGAAAAIAAVGMGLYNFFSSRSN